MPKIERLVVPCPTMRCPERLRFGPRFKHSAVFPDRVRSIDCVILSLRTLEKVKLYKARDFFEMTVARQADVLKSRSIVAATSAIVREYSSWLVAVCRGAALAKVK